MGDWWQDEEPWPGPKYEGQTWPGLFTSLGVAYARGAGKAKRQAELLAEHFTDASIPMERLAKHLKDLGLSLPDAPTTCPSTRDEVLARKKQKQHGPYRGGFDRRGRKI